jgi:hypothetical protein
MGVTGLQNSIFASMKTKPFLPRLGLQQKDYYMAGPLNAKVVMARCSKTKKSFGIRVEQRGKDWIRTWAFKMDEQSAKHEGFDANTITGSMNATLDFPGCPYCQDMGFVLCGKCKKIGCSGGIADNQYNCPWCGYSGELSVAESFDVSGGSY